MQTAVLKDDGEPAGVGEDGHLVITAPWPGMIRGTWGDDEGKRFKEVYFSMFKGVFTTGDGCAIDADGDHWLKGRIDDVLNVSGHRIGTSDVEGALVSYPEVAEAAVVGYPHPIKGTGIYAYVTLNDGVEPSDDLKKELVVHVRKVVGPIATPDKMQFAPPACPRPARARSCAASCARSPRASSTRWATPPRWPIRPSSRTSRRTSSSLALRETNARRGRAAAGPPALFVCHRAAARRRHALTG